jgi:hypothetical protein
MTACGRAVARELTLAGDDVYFDTLVIKFGEEFVETGDALRGRALLLFRRIFTDREHPAAGQVLDREGQAPLAYASEHAETAFERRLWTRFWQLANDPAEAAWQGVRALHGDAVSVKLKPGSVYAVTIRTTGELTIQPVP